MTLAEAHVLLVEDEPVLRLTMAVLLRREGVTVTEATSGVEALPVLQHGGIDLLLTDRNMPGMGGVELLRAAAADGCTVPGIVCGGMELGPPSDELRQLGVVATLTKPFSPPELLLLLSRVLQPLPPRC